MAKQGGLNIAVLGLGFGAEFVPIYLDHPDVGEVVACDIDPARVERVARRFPQVRPATSLEAIVGDSSINAVHVVSGLSDHVTQTLAVLAAGKHRACAVPMAMSIAELREVVRAQKQSGKNYMMMETTVYTRSFLFARELAAKGEFGRIQFLRGAHYQDLEEYPSYWHGFPTSSSGASLRSESRRSTP
jgi:predicted dehydrogenase